MAESWRYRVQVEGRLSERWWHWFDDMEVTITGEAGSDTTTMIGPIADQAALLGLLQRLYTLGLPLLSVRREDGGEREGGPSA